VRNGLTLRRIGIKALLQYPSVSTVMPTMNDTEEVLENVRASEAGKLTEEEQRFIETCRRAVFSKDPKMVLKENHWLWHWRFGVPPFVKEGEVASFPEPFQPPA